MTPNQEENPVPTPAQETAPIQPTPPTNSTQLASVENQAVNDVSAATPVVGLAPKAKTSTPKWLPIVIAAAVVLLIGGSVAAYKFWYQNPTKVLGDSVLHLLTEKGPVTTDGTFSIDSESVSVSITLDSGSKNGESTGSATVKITPKGNDFGNKSFTIKASATYVKDGVTYFKLSDIKQAVDDYIDVYADTLASSYAGMGYSFSEADIKSMRTSLHASVDPMVNKFDGQWIKLTADDLDGDTDSSAKQYRCTTDALKKFQNESDIKELQKVYEKHPFVTVKKELGSKNGSLGYELAYDNTKAKEFGEASKNTAIAKAIDACDDSKDSSISESSKDENAPDTKTFQVWVSRWGHKLTNVTYEGMINGSGSEKTTLKLDTNLQYNKSVTVEVPKDAKSFKDVIDDLKSVTGASEV